MGRSCGFSIISMRSSAFRRLCARPLCEVIRKPGDVRRVEMIGGFVEQQDLRLLQQQPCDEHLGALSAGQMPDFRIQSQRGKPQSGSNLFHKRINAVEIAAIQRFLQGSQFAQQRRLVWVFRQRLCHVRNGALHGV